ncbi:Uncharacterised protein [Bordetella pertussis]|nr:Uncharacterised protein [Bordetella pertussis]
MPLYLGVAAVLALAGALLSCAIAALVSFFRQRG